ncbi:ABC-type nickel/cobalt efflux system permease component RcnA [Rhizobium binae]|uniref:ABC-type nickel/cobalt efflux system permease component RcnA n=1 Tax=Rhizobium binae TaxID=1138190 RepID=A0ABV2MUB5_9HYPH
MRRVFLLTGAAVFAYAVWHVTMTRSTTIDVLHGLGPGHERATDP